MSIITKNASLMTPLSRRTVMKIGGAGAIALSASGIPLPFVSAKAQVESPQKAEKIVWSACTVNCGSRCPLRMHVSDGEITYVETDNTGEDDYAIMPQVRACARGRSMRRRVYNPDRLKYPMKRIGKRGEGHFERISWEQAYDEIATSLKKVIAEYGNEAVYLQYATGTLGGTVTRSWPPGNSLLARLMNCCGGYLNHYNTYSTAQITEGMKYTYGGAGANSISDIENSKLIVMFGNNPSETRMSGGGVTYFLDQARRRSNAKMIVIDPRYSDTAAGREDMWVPIVPGTDAALVAGMAYVMITENLHDQAFLDKYCVGFDEKTLPASAPKNGHYKAYILGQGEDGIEKTPQWAADITGIPAATIIKLAREIASAKPAYIVQGWGPQRHANGELVSRAIALLACMTGNIGVQGGNTGAREGSYSIPFVRFPTLTNPIKDSISFFLWTDAVERGKEMTAIADGVRGTDQLKQPIKFIWNYAGNCMVNQHSDINRTLAILGDESKCEMVVVIDNHMTASAKVADILLPDLTTSEQMDFCLDASSGNMGYVIFADKAIEPQFECRSIYEMTTEIAKRMGVEKEFTEGRTQEEWLRHLYAQSQAQDAALPSFEAFRKAGLYKRRDPAGHSVAYKAFRQDPVANPLTTPSGKIELYSAALATLAQTWQLPKGDVIHPLPIHVSTFEGYDSPEREQKYPLQLIGFHYKSRTHSTYGNVDVLQQASRQEMWINPLDAAKRGIRNGDLIKVFNDRGESHIPAKVTPRIIPGVVALGEGAWYTPDTQGIDKNGSLNVLTTLHPSPLAKGNPQHTNLVQVEKL